MLNILIRGGGDLASGVAARLYRCGFNLTIAELPTPMAVRRKVSFSEAVYEGRMEIEGITAICVDGQEQALEAQKHGHLPVVVDPDLTLARGASYPVIIDARIAKIEVSPDWMKDKFTVGLGPGFTAGVNCHAAIETERGHSLGRVIWAGSTNPDTGKPEGDHRRVFRAPCDGTVKIVTDIGSNVLAGDVMAQVGGMDVLAPMDGVVRGMLREGVFIHKDIKLGDVDPRNDPRYCSLISDKAYSVAGGVLEAIMTNMHQRKYAN